MTREDILKVVGAHRERLSELAVHELALFGSHARNEATEESDIDFVVEFATKSFDRYMELRELWSRSWIDASILF